MEKEVVTLRSLQIGQQFFAASDKNRKVRYEVRGNCTFNITHGSSTRVCFNFEERWTESKSCNLKVITVTPINP
jgi:hypothetical protein